MNEICRFVVVYNIDLNIFYMYVLLGSKFVDVLFCFFNFLDIMLSEKFWLVVELYFEFYYVDLMFLGFNVMRFIDGKVLKYFILCYMFLLLGVNLFCQNVRGEGNLYVYLLFVMIFFVLKFLEEQGVVCIVVVLKMNFFFIWWLKLEINFVGLVCLGLKGVVMIFIKMGFVVDLVGLRWLLFVFRLLFVKFKI